MPDDLMMTTPAMRRMVLLAYVLQSTSITPQEKEHALACLAVQTWEPMPETCPIRWAKVQAWYDGLARARVKCATTTFHEV